jgi:hypothetical protein
VVVGGWDRRERVTFYLIRGRSPSGVMKILWSLDKNYGCRTSSIINIIKIL